MGFFLAVIHFFAFHHLSDRAVLPEHALLAAQRFLRFFAQLFLGDETRHGITSFQNANVRDAQFDYIRKFGEDKVVVSIKYLAV